MFHFTRPNRTCRPRLQRIQLHCVLVRTCSHLYLHIYRQICSMWLEMCYSHLLNISLTKSGCITFGFTGSTSASCGVAKYNVAKLNHDKSMFAKSEAVGCERARPPFANSKCARSKSAKTESLHSIARDSRRLAICIHPKAGGVASSLASRTWEKVPIHRQS